MHKHLDTRRHSTASRRRTSAALLALTIALGLAWRLAPLHLPPFAFKYGGSALWAVAVYWALALLFVRRTSAHLAMVALAVSTAVECFKLVFWAPLDRFRETLPGKLLLGRYFTGGALLAYWLAIAAVFLLDAFWRSRGNQAG